MTVPTSAAKCSHCGALVPPGARFCAACGFDVSGEQGHAATARVAPRAAPPATALLQTVRHATAGEYEIHAELGRGGMATVFLAHDLALDRKVAIKVMSPALLSGEGMVERFKREARTAASLSHPHIIPIYAVRESEQLVFFIMKFVEGRPLDSIIKEVGPLPIPMVRAILQQVGAALAYAHRRGIVHRDVKPANVMIDADGWAIVTDFGIAKVMEKQGLTMTGATIGTPSYMSPEQCAAREVGGASDQYSLGVVAYEMVTGRLPFVADSVMAIMYAHFNEPPPPIASFRPECPPEIAAALARMLAKDPADRFPDVESAVAALGAVPLAHDDPIRTQMMTLAATGKAVQTLRRVAVPLSPSPTPSRTKAMTLAPSRVTVAVGGAVQLTAGRKSRGGATLPGDAITWASTNNDVAVVSDSGLVTAVGPGTVVITATIGTVSATGQVIVTPIHVRRGGRAAALAGTALAIGAIGVGLWLFGPWRGDGLEPSSPAQRPPAAETTAGVAAPPAAGQPVDSPAAPVSPAPAVTPPVAPPAARSDDRRDLLRERRRSDSILTVMRADAQTARGRALGVGATAGELASGDVQRDSAERLARQGRLDESFARLAQAQIQWSLAEQAARDRLAQAAMAIRPPPPPVVAPRVDTTPATPPAPSPAMVRQQIELVVAQYARAIANRDVAAIRRVYPALTRQQEQSWQDFFRVARDIRADLAVGEVRQSGDAAEVSVSGAFEFQNSQTRRVDRQGVSFQARLERGAGGWRIQAIHE